MTRIPELASVEERGNPTRGDHHERARDGQGAACIDIVAEFRSADRPGALEDARWRLPRRGNDVNDGRWHHVIAEVDRSAPQGIHIYIDGELHDGTWTGAVDAGESLSNRADFVVGKGVAGRGTGPARDLYFAGLIDFLRVARGTLADAETTIEQLYRWEFDGPFLKDFVGRRPTGARRDAGAIELGAVPAAPSK